MFLLIIPFLPSLLCFLSSMACSVFAEQLQRRKFAMRLNSNGKWKELLLLLLQQQFCTRKAMPMTNGVHLVPQVKPGHGDVPSWLLSSLQWSIGH
jgi:hypothetical protein